MQKVYCGRGAYNKRLRALESEGLIQLVHFPYEGRNRRIRVQATPSIVTWDCTYITMDSAIPIGEMAASEKYSEILAIIGSNNDFDARHLDSAYKSACACFLTPDKRNITRNSSDLEILLGFRIFHGVDDWKEFLAFVGSVSNNEWERTHGQ